MEREPGITFRGALRILGHHDRPWVDRLDRLLGGVILGAGVATATEAAIFGWVDQKNEATGLVRTALDTVSNRLLKTDGLARHELVIAAHTTIVLAAFWETVAAQMGTEFRRAEFTAAEKVRLGTGTWQRTGENLVRHLFEAGVPAPSAVKGFEENVAEVLVWADVTAEEVRVFLSKLGQLPMSMEDTDLPNAVAGRYRDDYVALAAKVPEFRVWADLGEHAATRTALSRLENLLTPRAQEGSRPRLRAQLREINRAELSRPIIDADIDGYGRLARSSLLGRVQRGRSAWRRRHRATAPLQPLLARQRHLLDARRHLARHEHERSAEPCHRVHRRQSSTAARERLRWRCVVRGRSGVQRPRRQLRQLGRAHHRGVRPVAAGAAGTG